MAAAVVDGVAVNREFAGADWPGLTLADELASLHRMLPLPDFWSYLADLFVRQDQWGTGLARTLHDAAVDEARDRGYRELRRFAAAGQARARRFYRREGWVQRGEPASDPAPGLEMVEYRLALR